MYKDCTVHTKNSCYKTLLKNHGKKHTIKYYKINNRQMQSFQQTIEINIWCDPTNSKKNYKF